MNKTLERTGAAPSNFAQQIVAADSELGPGFAFVGRQVHFDVGGDDFYIDLLFFHVEQLRFNCTKRSRAASGKSWSVPPD